MADRYLVGQTAAPQGVVVPENLQKKLTRNTELAAKKTAALAEKKKMGGGWTTDLGISLAFRLGLAAPMMFGPLFRFVLVF